MCIRDRRTQRECRRTRSGVHGVVGVVLASLVLTGAVVERVVALAKPGTAKPAASAQKTTLSGVYTAAQAAKGEDIYYTTCISCHPKGTYAGVGFKNNWNNRPLWDLWDWISNKMPKNCLLYTSDAADERSSVDLGG